MSLLHLTAYSDDGRSLAESRIDLSPPLESSALDGLQRRHLESTGCVWAAVRDEHRVVALFLAEAPPCAATYGSRRQPGHWVTTALRVGGLAGLRAFAGPTLFLRQIDLQPPQAWLAPVLMGLDEEVQVHERTFGEHALFEWVLYGERFLYAFRRLRWKLYCAGNTPDHRLEQALAAEPPTSARAFLWMVGAVRLA